MSRIGNKVIIVPTNVKVELKGNVAHVSGDKGKLEVVIPHFISLDMETAGHITVKRANEIKTTKQAHGTTRALLHNAIVGVSEGFTRKLELVGIGYRASMQGKAVKLEVGYSHDTVIEPVEGSTIAVLNPTTIEVSGYSKHAVGQTAANIRAVREPEPYLGKGIKYAGEHIIRKEGKRAGAKK
jgi:large subunit ribosomal protein L6